MKNGIINVGVINLDKEEKKDNDDENENKPKNEVKEINLNKFKKTSNPRSSLGKVIDKDYDEEELKRQILKK